MDTAWRKSSRSSNQGGQCLEARRAAGNQQVRDSKLGEGSPIFTLASADFSALLDAAR
ncbi:DUF397 domain-containing protein [Natronoglycomyces albus]|uniref:DUF397 domain-containing protein n=1 Tax=Natronoglycomyces albus TaxID=2811108 RepID=A0A895XRY1_9ACTN|nr:DUF397 domain-containing protein [Natronoglycomyces albus]QSB05945.1 DUF397 domain-containing protein [Natronoglycomyces albus]